MIKKVLVQSAAPLVMGAIAVAFIIGNAALQSACAHPRHVAVVADVTLFETLNDIHVAEQATLTSGVRGWTLQQSQAFNRKLLPAVEAGRDLNRALAAWAPGQPVPPQVHTILNGLTAILKDLSAEFPDGSTKSKILMDITVVQSIVATVVDAIVTAKSGG